jgi:hypothetical protein
MGNVTAPATVLEVGPAYYDSTGRLLAWEGSPCWTVGFAATAESGAATSWERLALAVGKASRQFMYIDEEGNHLTDDELDSTSAYTPNYVSDPALTPLGVSVYADTQGNLTPEMGETMLRVLVNELGRLPFDTIVSLHEDGGDEVIWRPPHLVLGKPTVIARAVRCVVNSGVPDVVIEYLDAQGGWTPSFTDARAFEPDGTWAGPSSFAWSLVLSMYEQA